MKNEFIRSHSRTKREFLRQCTFCVGGLSIGAFNVNLYSWTSNGELGKFSKEALFYKKTADGLQCEKCPQGCFLMNDGDVGFCRNRITESGKMYTIAYGNPCAVHVDPIEKKPFFHFLPATHAFSIAVAGCNFRCLNCQNWQISQVRPKETDTVDLMPEEVVNACTKSGAESIAYTYSEPTTFYEYAYETAKLAREHKIHNVWKSNGYINEKPLRQLCTVLDGANIDLKSFDDATYAKLSSGKLAPVLRTLKVLREEGVWLEITNLIIPTWTDDFDTLRRMCEWLCVNGLSDAPLHFSRFTPLYKLNQLPPTPTATLEKAYDIAVKSGIQYVYVGNVGGHWAENTICPKCKKIIVERSAYSILANHIAQGKCKFCGEIIPGVWC